MKNLKNATDEELKKELEERELRKKGPRPQLVTKPDLSRLVKMFEDHIAEVERGEISDDSVDDFKQYVYEETAQTLYGRKYFDWHNKFR